MSLLLALQNAGVGVAGTVAVTDAADLAAAVGNITTTGLATPTDGADLASASGAVSSTGSAALTDGADLVTGVGGLNSAGTAAILESADSVGASGSVASAGGLASTDGADALQATGTVGSAAITGTLNASDGADAVDATGTARQGGGYPTATKRRYIYQEGDRLVVTRNASAALAAADRVQELPPAAAAEVETAPQTIALTEIRQVAAQYAQQAQVLRLFRQRDWAEMVALYESLRRQQEEDDIELMLLSL